MQRTRDAQDTGCRHWSECSSCPFPACIYDDPRGARHAALAPRNQEIRRLFQDGYRAVDIAARFGVHTRSVYRAIGGVRLTRGR